MRGLLRSQPFVLVYLCWSVGPQGLLVVRLPDLLVPHSASLGPAMATGVLSALAAISVGLEECLFFISLVSDFLAVLFSVSSGCARRRSVSTYDAILVLFCLQLLYVDFVSHCFVLFTYYVESFFGGYDRIFHVHYHVICKQCQFHFLLCN